MDHYLEAYDVIVAGGGPAGVSAAVSAARMGAKTALIERYGILGGMLTSGLVNPVLGSVAPGTAYQEIMDLMGKECSATRNGREMSVDPEQAKYRLLKLAADAGVSVYLQTPVVDVVKEGSRVRGLVVGTQEGLKTLTAHALVDATGDGFVAARAGAEYQVGRDSDGFCQPITTEFVLDNVDEARAITCWGGTDPVTLPGGKRYSVFCQEAHDRGELPENVTIVRLHRTLYPGERSVNATQANGLNTLTPEGVVRGELTLRGQIDQVVAFLRNNIPGYESCRVKASGSSLGVRESRRIMGDYVLEDADVEQGRRQKDVVVHQAWFLIDIHNPAGGGQAEGHSQAAKPYDIPYRCLLPRGVEGLLTCGRCISGTHRAHASYRVMSICMATGQAAGAAAALSAREGLTPRELDVKLVQQALMDQGAVLFDSEA
mgnify:FL=1